MDYKLLGVRVREERVRKGLTQEALAEKCSISPSFVGIIERGDKKLSVETLVKITNILGVSTDYLLKDSLKRSSETRSSEIGALISLLEPSDVDLIVDTIATMSSHLKKR